jgi:hypothetical protein
MMKNKQIVVFILSVLMLLLFSSGIYARSKNINDLTQKFMQIRRMTVSIFNTNNARSGFCTGVVLVNKKDYAEVLTCKHCIEPFPETYVENNKISRIITSTHQDLALIKVKGYLPGKHSIKLAKYNLPLGETILTYGRPGITSETQDVGTVLRYTDDWGYADLHIIGGDSGSGVFNIKLELVGIIWGRATEQPDVFLKREAAGQTIGMFEKATDIREFLKEIEYAY